MSFIFTFSLLLILFLILVDIFFIYLISTLKKYPRPNLIHYPFVSVLISTKNEEENVPCLIESLKKIDYPSNKIEFLFGDDNSDDNTNSITRELTFGWEQFQIYKIDFNFGKARAKANVLAQLAHKAKGEILLVTDADIVVSPLWVKDLVANIDISCGINSGTTIVDGKSFFEQYQQIEWLYTMATFKCFADIGIPVSAVGNNMAFKKELYFKTGGYENIDFSITEDYKIFSKIMKQGTCFKALINPWSLNISTGTKNITQMFQQKKRWIKGAIELPWYHHLFLIICLLFLPSVILLTNYNFLLGISLTVVKFSADVVLIKIAYRKIERSQSLLNLILFPFCFVMVNFFATLYSFLPFRLYWKGRKYS